MSTSPSTQTSPVRSTSTTPEDTLRVPPPTPLESNFTESGTTPASDAQNLQILSPSPKHAHELPCPTLADRLFQLDGSGPKACATDRDPATGSENVNEVPRSYFSSDTEAESEDEVEVGRSQSGVTRDDSHSVFLSRVLGRREPLDNEEDGVLRQLSTLRIVSGSHSLDSAERLNYESDVESAGSNPTVFVCQCPVCLAKEEPRELRVMDDSVCATVGSGSDSDSESSGYGSLDDESGRERVTFGVLQDQRATSSANTGVYVSGYNPGASFEDAFPALAGRKRSSILSWDECMKLARSGDDSDKENIDVNAPGPAVSRAAVIDADYFFEDGNTVIKVDNTLFKLHRTVVVNQCLFVKEKDMKNRTERNPFEVKGVSAEDFKYFLYFLYPSVHINFQITREIWESVLKVTDKLGAVRIHRMAEVVLRRREFRDVESSVKISKRTSSV